MAITSTQKNSEGILRYATGSYLDDAASPADATITLGFTPKYVRWINVTDRDEWEWFDGADDGTTLKTVMPPSLLVLKTSPLNLLLVSSRTSNTAG